MKSSKRIKKAKKAEIIKTLKNVDAENELADLMVEFEHDPLGFVETMYPWEKLGTVLEKEEGPDTWQAEVLVHLGEQTISVQDAIQIAIASGHGIGKTALVAWIIHWFISTRPHPQIVVTANTKKQLETKTWRELAKWHKLSLNKHWFNWTATKFASIDEPETWFASAIPWSVNNAEAFAGTHEKHVLVIFDEASGIPDIIWETASGAMTTIGAIWIAFGNPTQNVGRFKECFDRLRHRWFTRQIDSRTAKKANKAEIAKWIEDYGEDSDYVRIRVKGVFPRASSTQLIPMDVVKKAVARDNAPSLYREFPIIIGVDVARFGDDQTVITVRQGTKVLRQQKFRGLRTNQVADLTALTEDEYNATAVFVDAGAMGAGVIDHLLLLSRHPIEIHFGGTSSRKEYFNKRAEMWGEMKKWLVRGGDIPDDPELIKDLIGVNYGFSDVKEKIQLEKKQDMKKRGLPSPDCGDSLAITFAAPVLPRMNESDFPYDNMPNPRESVDITTGY